LSQNGYGVRSLRTPSSSQRTPGLLQRTLRGWSKLPERQSGGIFWVPRSGRRIGMRDSFFGQVDVPGKPRRSKGVPGSQGDRRQTAKFLPGWSRGGFRPKFPEAGADALRSHLDPGVSAPPWEESLFFTRARSQLVAKPGRCQKPGSDNGGDAAHDTTGCTSTAGAFGFFSRALHLSSLLGWIQAIMLGSLKCFLRASSTQQSKPCLRAKATFKGLCGPRVRNSRNSLRPCHISCKALASAGSKKFKYASPVRNLV